MMDPSGRELRAAHPAKAGPQPVASLAWFRGRPWLRSVDSECESRVMEPRKNVVGADALPTAAGNTDVLEARMGARARVQRSDRGQRAGRAHIGDPQEPGRPCGFPPEGGYRRTKANEVRRGRAIGSRSAAIRPRKLGNLPEGPSGGKGGTGTWNRWNER